MAASAPSAIGNRGRRKLGIGVLGLLAATCGLSRHAVADGGRHANQGFRELSVPFRQQPASIANAPFGNQVSNSIDNYNRVSPYVATAGLLHRGGLEHIVELGFKVLIDLRGEDERGCRTRGAPGARTGSATVAHTSYHARAT